MLKFKNDHSPSFLWKIIEIILSVNLYNFHSKVTVLTVTVTLLMLLGLILALFYRGGCKRGSFSHNLWASFHILLVILPHVIIFLLERLTATEPCSALIQMKQQHRRSSKWFQSALPTVEKPPHSPRLLLSSSDFLPNHYGCEKHLHWNYSTSRGLNKIKSPQNNNRKRAIFTIAVLKYVQEFEDACERIDWVSAGAGAAEPPVNTLADTGSSTGPQTLSVTYFALLTNQKTNSCFLLCFLIYYIYIRIYIFFSVI